MSSLAEIARIKAEIAKLESARKVYTDSVIHNAIESRIDELRRELAQLQSSGRE
jgi:polyhydroxyalkanoate synthesis regulator phasin